MGSTAKSPEDQAAVSEISPVDSTESAGSSEENPKIEISKTAISQAAEDLKRIKRAHQWDPNLAHEKADAVDGALRDGDADEILAADALFSDDSPYEQVRAAVRNTDGEEVANTVRAWILGMLFVTIGSALNMFLSMR